MLTAVLAAKMTWRRSSKIAHGLSFKSPTHRRKGKAAEYKNCAPLFREETAEDQHWHTNGRKEEEQVKSRT